MESGLNGFDEEEHARPTLLMVLCILTFIGSSWLIVSNIWAYTTADKTAQMISSMKNLNKNDSTVVANAANKKRALFGEKMMLSFSKVVSADNIRKSAIGTIISAIITLLGAILMWRFKRSGFYLYISGTLIGILVPFYLYGINVMSIGISFFSGFFGLIFIALYALNIKSLR